MFKTYTAIEYLFIDIANQWGKDRESFETRIQWAIDNLSQLEVLGEVRETWKEYPLYVKAVQALRKVQASKPTGHMIGLDSICSGMQIMSALTGCIAGADATGLVDPDRRADAYTSCTDLMRVDLPALADNARSDIKTAVMTK